MRIAYITTYDSEDRSQWSGLGYAIMQALSAQGLDVEPIGPLRRLLPRAGRLVGRAYRAVDRAFEYDREAVVCRYYARQVEAALRSTSFDVVFSPGAIPISRLVCRQPIVTWADATFGSLISLYDEYSTLSARTIRAGHETDRQALLRSSLAIFASDWASESAVRDYGIDRRKIHVVPFGANFRQNIDCSEMLQSVHARSSDACNLISIGVDWTRKGMSRAIDLASCLNRRGWPTTLAIVGCYPPAGVDVPDFVKIIGFVDKRTSLGERRLTDLLKASHFHVLFSKAECFGVVFAEANAHAVPNLASDSGGIKSAVIDDHGGWTYPNSDPIEKVADKVISLLCDRDAYCSAANAARLEYDSRLNWRVSGLRVLKLLEKIVG